MMDRKIHYETVCKLFIEKFGVEIDTKEFINNQTGEVYNLIFDKGTDIALFSMRDNDEYICLNSNGDEIDKDKIYSYINGVNVKFENYKMTISEKDLVLRCKDQTLDIEELIKREAELFPERTTIVLKGMFSDKGHSSSVTNFYVDEIAEVSENDFKSIRDGDDSQILVKYNEKTYEPVTDGVHGILVIGPDGDGMMIDTQGHDYAKYVSYAPQIGMPIQYMINKQMRESAAYEIKFYVPMSVSEYDEEENEVKVDGQEYYDAIDEAFKKANAIDDERGLANYIHDENLKLKIYSITPELTVENNKLMAVAIIRLTKPLEDYELEELRDFCVGQFSDGWGESSYFDGIRTDGTYLFVHFLDEANESVMTEDEMKQMFDQSMNENTQEMQGMSGM